MTFTSRRLLLVGLLSTLALAPGCPSSTTADSDAGLGADGGRDGGGGATDTGVDAGGGSTDTGVDAGGGGTDTGVDGGGSGSDAGTDGGTDAASLVDANVDAGVRVPMYHRASDAQCAATAPPGTCSFGGGGGLSCADDAECTAGTNGRCNQNHGGAAICFCTYDTCMHDTDCPSGQTCACHGDPLHPESNQCVDGNCRTDADCGTGLYCSPTIAGCGALGGYYCHTASDTCLDDSDCTSSGRLQGCQYSSTAHRWECTDLLLCP